MTKNKYIIKDPIYGTMSISARHEELIKPVINHPLFQRLRHIKQLSFVDLIFPGAVHTRFNHSLGCAYNCNRIYQQLFQNKKTSRDEILIILAGLLHDVGHGPFSHSFENLSILKNHKIKHEDWFDLFVEEIFEDPALKKHKSIATDLKDLFSKNYSGKPWKKGVISSQLDADRMDYILRDSKSCGVKYGEYDIDWLIDCLEVNNGNLTISEKGVGVAEQFLHSRHLLYKNVYLNLKTTAISYCVLDFLEELFKDVIKLKKINKNNNLFKFLKKANEFRASSDKDKFMPEIYKYYKCLVDFDVWSTLRDYSFSSGKKVSNILARRIYYRKLPVACRIKQSYYNYVKSIVENEKDNLKEWQIKVIKCPISFYSEDESNEVPIYIKENTGSIRTLSSVSKTISNISNQIDSICFLYVDQEAHKTKVVKKIISECNKNAVFVYDYKK